MAVILYGRFLFGVQRNFNLAFRLHRKEVIIFQLSKADKIKRA